MAEKDRRTQPATPKRRDRARGEGKVARSTDLAFGAILLTTGGVLALTGGRIPTSIAAEIRGSLALLPGAGGQEFTSASRHVIERAVFLAAPLLGLLVPIGLAVSFLQVGFHPKAETLRPRPERLVPNLSITRFVNPRSLLETGTSLLKAICLTATGYLAVRGSLPTLFESGTAEEAARNAGALAIRVLLALGVTLVAIGVVDFLLRRRQHETDLRMTPEEVKDERRDAEGDPEIRMRQRRALREIARRRMMEEIPRASVVVTNPTHVSVALRYVAGAGAPRVVAKGRGWIALRIREIARLTGVPLVENPPLARTLHDSVPLGAEVPATLYRAVAEVLAAVLRARGRLGRPA